MKKTVTMTLLMALLGLILVSCGKEEKKEELKLEAKAQGTLIFVLGKVEVSRDGKEWKTAALNDKVKAGDWILTGAKSQAKIQIWNSTSFLVQANTKTRIETLTSGQQFALNLEKGSVRCEVEKIAQEKGYYQVKGLAMAAGVRGTQFDFTSDGEKEVLKVKEGRVAVKRNLEGAPESIVEAGQGAVISVKENEALKKKLDGKSKEEQEKILSVPLKNEADLEAELPAEMREMVKQQDKMVEEASKKQEAFVEKKAQEVESTAQTQEKKIEAMTQTKSKEIDQMMQGDDSMGDMDSMLKKAKDRKKQQ